MEKSEIGKLGEDIASKYLIQEGFKILVRNAREKWGEIDIVAKDKDGVLAFVEVKTVREGAQLTAEEHLTRGKLRRMKKAALLYAGHFQNLVDDKKGWRIDLAAITIKDPSGDFKVRYYENVFY